MASDMTDDDVTLIVNLVKPTLRHSVRRVLGGLPTSDHFGDPQNERSTFAVILVPQQAIAAVEGLLARASY